MLQYTHEDNCVIVIEDDIIKEIFNIHTNKQYKRIGSHKRKFIVGNNLPDISLIFFDKLDDIKIIMNIHGGLDINTCGIFRKYNVNKILIEEYFHNNGIKEGIYKKFYDDGIIEMEANYINNKLNGLVKNYSRSGKLRSEYTYVNDILNGKAIEYERNYSGIYNYRNGVKHGEYNIKTSEYEESGIYENDYLIESIRIDKNNILLHKIYKISSTHYICEKYRVSINKSFLENKKTFCFSTKKLDGLCQEYHFINDKLKSEINYIDGKKNGLYTEYFIDNSIRIQCNYKNDIKSGDFIEYHPNGKLYKKIFYVNDVEFNKKIYDNNRKLIEYLIKDNKNILLDFKYNGDTNVLTEFLNELNQMN
jgi:antitoxin component YwqK of YwqJK toxin-antitoxin module